ncbi:phage tail assembly chaperone G [Staphylococcus chromogenes]|uniref:phage tail assembly chaperone G n=1 Tax=Staphylococcus chromogenes TaxID=46126 RepID=UPI001FD56330|nr:hypothetical protein [Staphylococcus chromogenes]
METYLTPHFIPLDVLYEATDIMVELEKVESGDVEMSFGEQLDKLIDAVVKIYGKQFTKKDVKTRCMRQMQLKHFKSKLNLLQTDNKTKNKKVYPEHQLKDEDLTYEGMQMNLDKVVKDMIENGMAPDQVLKMHFTIYYKY